MKTIKQVINENSNLSTIIRAVVRSIGKDSIDDVNNYGIDGGYSGFIYYGDTHKFAMKHRKTIISMLEETAYSLGEDTVAMVASFGVFRDSPMDDDDKKDLYKYLGGGRPQQGTITNVLAWFAAEEVCRLFEE